MSTTSLALHAGHLTSTSLKNDDSPRPLGLPRLTHDELSPPTTAEPITPSLNSGWPGWDINQDAHTKPDDISLNGEKTIRPHSSDQEEDRKIPGDGSSSSTNKVTFYDKVNQVLDDGGKPSSLHRVDEIRNENGPAIFAGSAPPTPSLGEHNLPFISPPIISERPLGDLSRMSTPYASTTEVHASSDVPPPRTHPSSTPTAVISTGFPVSDNPQRVYWTVNPFQIPSVNDHSQEDTSIHPPPLSKPAQHPLTVISVFCLDTLPRQVYLHLLLRLPYLYFSRLTRIFHDAELSLPEMQKLALVTWARLHGVGDYIPISMRSELNPARSEAFTNLKVNWEAFIESLMTEWKMNNIVAVLLLSAILTTLQIDGVSNDPIARNAALTSLVCGLMGLLYGCMYTVRFGTMRRGYKAIQWAEEAQQTKTQIFWNVWVFLAMPAVWLCWSIILFIVSIMAYVWMRGSNHDDVLQISPTTALAPRIVVTGLFGIGILYFGLILHTLRRYGDIMDEKWKKRVASWVKENIPREAYINGSRSRNPQFLSAFPPGFEQMPFPATPPFTPYVNTGNPGGNTTTPSPGVPRIPNYSWSPNTYTWGPIPANPQGSHPLPQPIPGALLFPNHSWSPNARSWDPTSANLQGSQPLPQPSPWIFSSAVPGHPNFSPWIPPVPNTPWLPPATTLPKTYDNVQFTSAHLPVKGPLLGPDPLTLVPSLPTAIAPDVVVNISPAYTTQIRFPESGSTSGIWDPDDLKHVYKAVLRLLPVFVPEPNPFKVEVALLQQPAASLTPFPTTRVMVFNASISNAKRLPDRFGKDVVVKEDWERFVTNMELAWKNQYPTKQIGPQLNSEYFPVSQYPRRPDFIASLLHWWNKAYFTRRGTEAFLCEEFPSDSPWKTQFAIYLREYSVQLTRLKMREKFKDFDTLAGLRMINIYPPFNPETPNSLLVAESVLLDSKPTVSDNFSNYSTSPFQAIKMTDLGKSIPDPVSPPTRLGGWTINIETWNHFVTAMRDNWIDEKRASINPSVTGWLDFVPCFTPFCEQLLDAWNADCFMPLNMEAFLCKEFSWNEGYSYAIYLTHSSIFPKAARFGEFSSEIVDLMFYQPNMHGPPRWVSSKPLQQHPTRS